MKERPHKPASSRRLGKHTDRRIKKSDSFPQTQKKDSPELVQPRAPLGMVGLVILDRQGRIRELNEKTARLLGFSREWLINRPFVVFVAKVDVDCFLGALMSSARQSGHHVIQADLNIGNQ